MIAQNSDNSGDELDILAGGGGAETRERRSRKGIRLVGFGQEKKLDESVQRDLVQTHGAVVDSISHSIGVIGGGRASHSAMSSLAERMNSAPKSNLPKMIGYTGGNVDPVTRYRHVAYKITKHPDCLGYIALPATDNVRTKSTFLVPNYALPGAESKPPYAELRSDEKGYVVTCPVYVKNSVVTKGKDVRETIDLVQHVSEFNQPSVINCGLVTNGGKTSSHICNSFIFVCVRYAWFIDGDGDEEYFKSYLVSQLSGILFHIAPVLENPKDHNAYMERLMHEVIEKHGLDALKSIFAVTRQFENVATIPNIWLLHKYFDEINEGREVTGNKRLRFYMVVNVVTPVSSVAAEHKRNRDLHVRLKEAEWSTVAQTGKFYIGNGGGRGRMKVTNIECLMVPLPENLSNLFKISDLQTMIAESVSPADIRMVFALRTGGIISGHIGPISLSDEGISHYLSGLVDATKYPDDVQGANRIMEGWKRENLGVSPFAQAVTAVASSYDELQRRIALAYDIEWKNVSVFSVDPPAEGQFFSAANICVFLGTDEARPEKFKLCTANWLKRHARDTIDVRNIYILTALLVGILTMNEDDTSLSDLVSSIFEYIGDDFEYMDETGDTTKEETGKNALLFHIYHYVYVVIWTVIRLLKGNFTNERIKLVAPVAFSGLDWYSGASNALRVYTALRIKNVSDRVGGFEFNACKKGIFNFSPWSVIRILAWAELSCVMIDGEPAFLPETEVKARMADKNFASLLKHAQDYVASFVPHDNADRRVEPTRSERIAFELPTEYERCVYKEIEPIELIQFNPLGRTEDLSRYHITAGGAMREEQGASEVGEMEEGEGGNEGRNPKRSRRGDT